MSSSPMANPLYVPGGGGGGLPGPPGPPGTEIIVPNEAAASALAPASTPDGTSIFVLTERSVWRSDPASTIALVPNRVIARNGGGVLTRTDYADPQWADFISDIYVDPANSTGIASNENKGFFNAPQVGNARQPLLTLSEVDRRLGRQLVSGDPIGLLLTVHIISSMDPAGTDRMTYRFTMDLDTFPYVQGEAPVTVFGPIALTAATPQNPAVPAPGGTAASVQVGATVWAPFIGKRMQRIADGSVATVLKDLGGGVARISQPQLSNAALFGQNPTDVVWAAGDIVVVEDLTSVNMGSDWEVSATGTQFGFGQEFNVVDLQLSDLTGQTIFEPSVHPGAVAVFYQSVSDQAISQDPSLLLTSCTLRAPVIGRAGGLGHVFGGAVIVPGPVAIAIVRRGTFTALGVIDNGTYIQGGAGLNVNDAMSAGSFSVWDTVVTAANPGGHALQVGGPPSLTAGTAQMTSRGTVPIFGTGAAGKGIRIASGSKKNYTTLPNITGALGDLQLADSVIGQWGDIATGTYNPPGGIALTWAAVAAAKGIAGFGGSAHWIDQDAHLNRSAAT